MIRRICFRGALGISALVGMAVFTAALPVTVSAENEVALLPTHTLLLTERFTKNAGPVGGQAGGPDTTRSLVTMLGEREGFQVAVRNNSQQALNVVARINADKSLEGAAGTVDVELLRVGFVNVPVPSTKLGTKAGEYADPLPPLASSDTGEPNLMTIQPGEWAGVVALARVRTTASAGTYTGAVEIISGQDVVARQPFSIDVRGVRLMQDGDPGSFTTTANVEGEAYWLQHKDMRNRVGTNFADRMAQLGGLISFLESRGITPLEMPFGNPSKSGAYSCSFQSKGVPSQSFFRQLVGRYYAGTSDIDPTRSKFGVRFAPHRTAGCDLDKRTQYFEPTLPAGSSAKQDDRFNPAASKFYKNVRSAWNSGNLWGKRTYVKHAFDEPSGSKAAYRRTMDREVPKATIAAHKAFGKSAKVIIADWPRDSRSSKTCRKFGSGQRCTNLSGDEWSNKKQWDGKGADDPDAWMVPFSRLYGRTTSPKLARDYKVNREQDYARRLASIRKLKGGRETWAYNFYTADRRMPQLSIDAPGTDARLQYWMLARDGHTGLYVSNVMIGWASAPQYYPNTRLLRKGDPYEQALYFQHGTYGSAAGWGTFIYPGYVPSLGLDGEQSRNSEQSYPVSSLRLEGMRDGAEDANLQSMYRKAKGEAAYKNLMQSIFPGRYIPLTGNKLGNVVTLYYDNENDLAGRMEAARRAMIDGLSS